MRRAVPFVAVCVLAASVAIADAQPVLPASATSKPPKKKHKLRWDKPFKVVDGKPFVATTLAAPRFTPDPRWPIGCFDLLPTQAGSSGLAWRLISKDRPPPCSAPRATLVRFVANSPRVRGYSQWVDGWHCHWWGRAVRAMCSAHHLKMTAFEAVRAWTRSTKTGFSVAWTLGFDRAWPTWAKNKGLPYSLLTVIGRGARCRSSAIASEVAFSKPGAFLLAARLMPPAIVEPPPGRYTVCVHVQRFTRDRFSRLVLERHVTVRAPRS